MQCVIQNTELSSLEGTRCQFNGSRCAIKLGIDVHQDFYVVVIQEDGSNPKPPQRFAKEAFLHWAARLKEKSDGAEVYAVYEACGFGFGLQRRLSVLGIHCYVVCPQKLDERNRRVKTDGLDAKALCLRLDRFVQGNRDALAIVRVPSEQGVRCFHSPLIDRMNPGRSSSRFYRIRKSREMSLRVHRKRTRRKRDRE
jgi:hypothetical protein